jgi:hypothetical protein
VFDEWRRAIGMSAAAEAPDGGDVTAPRKRPSLAKHLDRVAERLGTLTGRLDLAPDFRDGLEAIRERVSAMRQTAHGARGEARDTFVAALPPLDQELLALARRFTPGEVWQDLVAAAEADLAPYRGRLSPGDWTRSVEATAVRLLRDRFGLPTIEMLT